MRRVYVWGATLREGQPVVRLRAVTRCSTVYFPELKTGIVLVAFPIYLTCPYCFIYLYNDQLCMIAEMFEKRWVIPKHQIQISHEIPVLTHDCAECEERDQELMFPMAQLRYILVAAVGSAKYFDGFWLNQSHIVAQHFKFHPYFTKCYTYTTPSGAITCTQPPIALAYKSRKGAVTFTSPSSDIFAYMTPSVKYTYRSPSGVHAVFRRYLTYTSP